MTTNKRLELTGPESALVMREIPMYEVPPNGLILKVSQRGQIENK